MTFRTPLGLPVLVHCQVGDTYRVFVGLALRYEGGYGLGDTYRGRISVVMVGRGWGQNESLEIIHNLRHFSMLNSASYWVYPDEYELMEKDVRWDEQQKQLQACLAALDIKTTTRIAKITE